VVNMWNTLHNFVVSANNVNMFTHRSDNLWKYQRITYDFKAWGPN